MEALPQQTEILIVGAGPTGLVAALSLHRHGCTDLVVVDGALEGENASRAVVIHAATLEARCFTHFGIFWAHISYTRH